MAPSLYRFRRMRLLIVTTLFTALMLTALTPRLGHAEVARVELHTFQSTTLTDQEFLTGKKEGKPVILAGELRIPKLGTEHLPAVVLVHGSGGVSGYVDDWAQWLNALGVATFAFDSFTARGIVNTATDQAQLGRLAATLPSPVGRTISTNQAQLGRLPAYRVTALSV